MSVSRVPADPAGLVVPELAVATEARESAAHALAAVVLVTMVDVDGGVPPRWTAFDVGATVAPEVGGGFALAAPFVHGRLTLLEKDGIEGVVVIAGRRRQRRGAAFVGGLGGGELFVGQWDVTAPKLSFAALGQLALSQHVHFLFAQRGAVGRSYDGSHGWLAAHWRRRSCERRCCFRGGTRRRRQRRRGADDAVGGRGRDLRGGRGGGKRRRRRRHHGAWGRFVVRHVRR